ncbi:hypothetical protein NKG05_28605 [Oerskovia sp. M15]
MHNAGVLDTAIDGPAALRSFDTNAVGIVRVTEAALPCSAARRTPTSSPSRAAPGRSGR